MSEQSISSVLSEMLHEVQGLTENLKVKAREWKEYLETLPPKFNEFSEKAKERLEDVQGALTDMSPVPTSVTTNKWLVESYIWNSIGSTIMYIGSFSGRYIAPIFFGWWVTTFWSAVTCFLLIPATYLSIETCPPCMEAVGSNNWTRIQHRLHLMFANFLLGAAHGFTHRFSKAGDIVGSVFIPVLVGIGAYFLGPFIDRATPSTEGAGRVAVIAGVVSAALLPTSLLILLYHGPSVKFFVTFIMTVSVMITRFQLMLWRSSEAPRSEWVDTVLPIILTVMSLLNDSIVRCVFAEKQD